MKKLLFILLFSVLTIGCRPDIKYKSCDVQEDCQEGMFCSDDGHCFSNVCLDPDIDCGKGKCIPTGAHAHKCECFENAVLIPERAICVPTCDGYSEECTEFGKTTDFDRCNMEKGHCDTKCQGEGSCQDGYYCSNGGACRRGPCQEGGCQDGFTCQDGVCEID